MVRGAERGNPRNLKPIDKPPFGETSVSPTNPAHFPHDSGTCEFFAKKTLQRRGQ